MTDAERRALVARYYEVWHRGDLDAFADLYTPDWVGHFPQGLELHGPAGHKQFGAVFGAAFPDGRYTVEETLVAGDRVVTRYTFRGTRAGPLRGLPATGRAVALTGITIQRLAGGRIAEQWAEYDMLGLLQQLGAIPT
jgi:steroid delta-isomerase-like uncharacterized protein